MTETTETANIPSAFKLSNINELVIEDDKGVLLKKGSAGITFFVNDDKLYIRVHNG